MESTDQTTKPRRSRKRKILKYVLLTPLVIIVLLVIAGLWHHFHLLSLIEAEKQQIADRGEPVTVADLEAAYALPADVVDRTDEWISVIDELTLIVDDPAYEPLPIVGDSQEKIPLPGEPWEQQALVEQLLAEAEPALERLKDLLDEPEAVRYPLEFNKGIMMMLPNQQNLRNVVRVLSLKARWQVYRGESQGALESLLAMPRITDTLKHEPIVLSQFLRIAFTGILVANVTELLPHADWSETQLKQLQEEILTLDAFQRDMQLAYHGERVIGHETFANPLRYDAEINWDIGPLLHADHVYYLQAMQRVIEAHELSYAEARIEFDAIRTELEDMNSLQRYRHSISRILLPTTDSTHKAVGRGTVSIRSTATLIACERYYLAHGSWPQQLNDLVPQFMESVPVDPYDGQPLRYQVTPEAVVVYSIGSDLVDDGGTTISEENTFEPDIVFRRKLGE